MATTTKAVFVPTTDNQAFANTIVQSLDGLAEQRKKWERTEYKKANKGLYDLLAECLQVYTDEFLKAVPDNRKTLRNELASRLKADDIKVQKNTTTLTMFVRYVFGSDRKRAHGYTYVLMAALSQDVAASELANYIVEQGGVEEIKRKMVISQEAQAKRAARDAAKGEVKGEIEQAVTSPLATVALNGLTGKYAVLLGKPAPDGTVSVVGVLSDADEVLINALLARMAKVRIKDNETNAQLAKETAKLPVANAAANADSYKKAA
jgi:hypothetical protein